MLILAAACYDLAFALFHLAFWRLFGWPGRLEPAGPVNSAVMQVLNIMLTFIFVAYAAALLGLGAAAPATMLMAGSAFWLLRMLLQPVYFAGVGWRAHVFTPVFALGAGLHAAAAWG